MLESRDPIATQSSHAPEVNPREAVQDNRDIPPDADSLIAELQEHVRQFKHLQQAETRLTNHIKAIERRLKEAVSAEEPSRSLPSGGVSFFASLSLQNAKAAIHKDMLVPKLKMEKLAKQLPIWGWAEGVRGIGPSLIGQIVGEAGNLSNYANPAKLWKRFGLAVIDGRAQGRRKGEEALEHGFSTRRRALFHNVGECLVRAKNEIYYAIYLTRKEYEKGRNPDIEDWKAHKRALRYMEKRFLRDMWNVWNGQRTFVTQAPDAS